MIRPHARHVKTQFERRGRLSMKDAMGRADREQDRTYLTGPPDDRPSALARNFPPLLSKIDPDNLN
jgi:hypothetical protein